MSFLSGWRNEFQLLGQVESDDESGALGIHIGEGQKTFPQYKGYERPQHGSLL